MKKSFIKFSLVIGYSWIVFISAADVAFAQFVTCVGADCGSCQLVEMVNQIIVWLFGIAAIIFGIIMAVAGFGLVTSRGNTSALEAAKSKFTNAIIGLIIMMSAWLIIDIIMRGLLPGTEGKINGVLFWADVECTQQTTTLAYEPPTENDPPGNVGATIPSPPSSPDGQVCYAGPGPTPVCFPAHDVPNLHPYEYPTSMPRPDRFIKYSDVNNSTKISRYYTFCQLTRCNSQRTGDYVFLDPRAVLALDRVTDSLGSTPLTFNSGFRSPAYNAQIGGAPHSTHMRGIAFDIATPPSRSTAQVAQACRDAGAGWTRQYPTFTHCDWR